jgi:RNA polymerase sigma-70 factor, ECF subfamily
VPLPEIDDRIVREAQRGDPHAFTLIVRGYQVPVFNYVLRIVGDRGLAEDLTQEVFLRVFQSLPSFSFRSRFTTWLFQVTRYRVLDELRARERRPRSIELDAGHTLSVVDAPAEQAETIEALWRAVDRLGLDLKMAVATRHRRLLLQRDRGDPRDHAGDREVANLQGAGRGFSSC